MFRFVLFLITALKEHFLSVTSQGLVSLKRYSTGAVPGYIVEEEEEEEGLDVWVRIGWEWHALESQKA